MGRPTRVKPSSPPLVIFEDDHLVAIDKPAGINTHAPSPFAGEGIYDWMRHREPRWSGLALIHRLDKETSGIMLFAKSSPARRSLTDQFSARTIQKRYLLITDRDLPRAEFTAASTLVRVGERWVSRPPHAGGEHAETRFRVVQKAPGRLTVEAEPLTGRTHQIRVHAAEHGFPILGDTLYGGTEATRLHLHAAELILAHPVTGATLTLRSYPPFGVARGPGSRPAPGPLKRAIDLRRALIDPLETDAFRILHGASDGFPGWHVDRLGKLLLSQADHSLHHDQLETLKSLLDQTSTGAYHKVLNRLVQRTSRTEASPQHVVGETVSDPFLVRENGLQFELRFDEGYSVGLFLDQRDNRRRVLINHVAADFPLFEKSPQGAEVLNTFAYTCAFSVCAAKAGARTTSIDLSKKYLDWGRRNFARNQIETSGHDFIYGDALQWLRRLARKKRLFDLIILDPPTFSQSKEGGAFRAEKDYGALVTAALPLLGHRGVLFASTNAAGWKPEDFLEAIEAPLASAGRQILQRHYVPQPPDFPISRDEPAYLKTVWLRLS